MQVGREVIEHVHLHNNAMGCHFMCAIAFSRLVGWLCFMCHRQRGHLETAPPFTVPCKGREARFLHCSHQETNPAPSRGSPLHYRCTTPASHFLAGQF